jgi:glucokinase
MGRQNAVLALDIGGTKIEAGLVDTSGNTLQARRIPTSRVEDAEAVWCSLLELIEGISGPFVGVGVACPGPMTRGGELVSPLHIPAWRSFPLRRRLAQELSAPIAIDNDAKAMVLGEAWLGCLRGRQSAMCVTVSTGVGSGILLDGRLLQGADGNAGHIGHTIVAPLGRRCACGARGCLEAEVSGLALEAKAGHSPPFPERLLRSAGELLGRAISSAAALLDLEAVALGGGVVHAAGASLIAAAEAEVSRSFRLFRRPLRLEVARVAPLVGAAALALGGARVGAAA